MSITAYLGNFAGMLEQGVLTKSTLDAKEQSLHNIVAGTLRKALANGPLMASVADDFFNSCHQLATKNNELQQALMALMQPQMAAQEAQAGGAPIPTEAITQEPVPMELAAETMEEPEDAPAAEN